MPVLPKSTKRRNAFTLMEMVVALGILAIVMSFAGVIFRVSADSHRLALANAEILQKLRAITEQLDADFRGLRKDGEVAVFWRAARKDPSRRSNAEEAFDRFDRIMFFADGDFQTYGTYKIPPNTEFKPVRGSVAWICYALANGPAAGGATEPNRPKDQRPQDRILARTVHILMPPLPAADPRDPLNMSAFTDNDWRAWMSTTEFDAISMRGWELMDSARKADILSVIGDTEVKIDNLASRKNSTAGGITVDPAQPQSLQALLCRGVGYFEIQGWNDAEQRWIPSVNPNDDAGLQDDSDFTLSGDDPHLPEVPGQWNPHKGSNLDPQKIPGVWYPRGPAILGNTAISPLDGDFNRTPGLGRALKFTFTLYDSRGLIPDGRTFTHIVYLDN